MRVIFLIIIFSISVFGQVKETHKDALNKIIPRFKQAAIVSEMFKLLAEEAIGNVPDKVGINLIYIPKREDDPFSGIKSIKENQIISLDLEGLTFLQIIKHICEVGNLRFKINENAVVVSHPTEVSEKLITKFYKLSFVDLSKIGNEKFKSFLESKGVMFSQENSVTYLKNINRLAVTNTAFEQEKIKDIISSFSIEEKLDNISLQLNTLAQENGLNVLSEIQEELQEIKALLQEQKSSNKKFSPLNKQLNLIIPKVRFMDRDLDFAVDFLKRISRDLSKDEVGINIILSVQSHNLKLNLNLDNVPVGELIQYICLQLGLTYKVQENTVIIRDNIFFDGLETQFYDITPGLLEFVNEHYKNNALEAFKSLGVDFDPGTKITYLSRVLKMVITNDSRNQKKLKEIFEFFKEKVITD